LTGDKIELYRTLATKMVNDCLRVSEGEMVWIASMREALDLAEEVALECDKKGAKPLIQFLSDHYMTRWLAETDIKFVETPQEHVVEAFNKVDVYIGLGKPALKETPAERISAWRRMRKPMNDAIDSREIRWLAITFPTRAMAEVSNMPFKKFEKAVLNALEVDYQKVSDRGKQIINNLLGTKSIHVSSGKGTDLRFEVTGRKWLNDDGILDDEDIANKDIGMNLPAGEVFVAPIEESANGTAFFDVPTSYFGATAHNIKLTFQNGKVVDFKVEKGEENFRRIFETATGDKDKIAEFAMGTNPKATFITDITQDEKVLGTVHIAIGDNKGPAYGGKNDSSLHWDLIMTKPTVETDGKTIMKDGKFRI